MSQPSIGLTDLPACLEDVKIKSLPNSAYYIADFISETEEAVVLNKIAAAPKPRWKILAHRRLQTWPSSLTNDTLLESSLPQWLSDPIIPRMLSLPMSSDCEANIFTCSPHQAPNHVLINKYLSGQGIMPHKDGSAYYPVVCTVSLGSSLCLDIFGSNEDGSRENQPRGRIFQEPRSLLITTRDIYTDYLHGIADITVDVDLDSDTVANWSLLRSPDDIAVGINRRATRISLTYRDVLRTIKLGSKIGILSRR